MPKNNKGRTLYVLYGGRCPGEQVTEGECLDIVRNTHITERTDEWFYITVTTAAPWSRAVSKQTAVTPPKNRTAVDSGMVCTQRLRSFADCSSASVREAELRLSSQADLARRVGGQASYFGSAEAKSQGQSQKFTRTIARVRFLGRGKLDSSPPVMWSR